MVDFEVHLTEYGGEIRVKYPAGQNLYQAHSISDVEATRSFEKLKQELPRYRQLMCLASGAPAYLARLELPEQNLGDRATRALVEALLFGSVRVSQVYLYKCCLGDAGAQALACLVEHSPKPGVESLHLSHNYFSPIGVKFIIDAARRCKKYPIESVRHPHSGAIRKLVPLWLRVDNQYIPWPGYEGKEDLERLQITEKRVEDLNEILLKKSFEDGTIPFTNVPWEKPRLICIPAPSAQRLIHVDPSVEDGVEEFDTINECSKYRCKCATKDGPLVHLPLFWVQGKTYKRLKPDSQHPEAASISLREAGWKSWFPRVPRPRVQPAMEAPPMSLAIEGPKQVTPAGVNPDKETSEKVVMPSAAENQGKAKKEKKDKKSDEKKQKKEKKEKKEKKAKKDKRADIAQEAASAVQSSVAEQVERETEDLFGSEAEDDDDDDDEVAKALAKTVAMIDTCARQHKQPTKSIKRRKLSASSVSEHGVEQDAIDSVVGEEPEMEPEEEEFEFVPQMKESMPDDSDEELDLVD